MSCPCGWWAVTFVPLPKPSRMWLNGHVVPWSEGPVHVWTELATRGCNVFEGLRGYRRPDGRVDVLNLQQHLARLYRSADLLRLPAAVDEGTLTAGIGELLQTLGGTADLYIRPTLYLAEGRHGTTPEETDAGAYIVAVPVPAEAGACGTSRCLVSSYRKQPSATLSALIKTGATYLTYRLPIIEAMAAGCDEAILLGTHGRVTETTSSSVFGVRKRRLTTPPLSEGILDSITRANVIVLARELGVDVDEAPMTRDDLVTFDELFTTGTLSGVRAVTHVDDTTIGGGSVGVVTEELWRRYTEICQEATPDRHEWLTAIPGQSR